MKKGFVLMETITVIIVVSVTLLAIFTSYNKILSKLRTENKYDTIDYIYMTYYIKNILSEKLPSASIYNLNSGGTLNNYYNNISNLVNNFNVKKIYLINNINNTKNDKLKKFDAYIIDYIKQLDENDNVSLILVEYKKEALNSSGAPLKDNKGNIMYETYISSLEW